MKIFFQYSIISLALIVFLSACVYASTTGKISGRVTDSKTGEPLPFVNVVIEGSTIGAASDEDGYYVINNITPGTYTIKVSAIGYSPVSIQNIKVNIGLTTNIDIELTDESFQLNDVIVVADKPMVQKDLTASTSIVNSELISNLPVTEMRDILQLQAGVVVSGGDLHLRGGRRGQIVYQIDGVPVTDAYDGSNVIDVGTNSIQELQMVSGAFNAEYGHAMSGIVNIVTKDGDNKFSGNVQAYSGFYVSSRDDIFWGIRKVDPMNIRNIEGSFSGPIISDRLFFYTYGRYYYNEGYLNGKRTYLTFIF